MQSRIPHNRIINSTAIVDDSRDGDFVEADGNDDEDSLIVKEWSHQLLSHKKAFRSSAVLPIITG